MRLVALIVLAGLAAAPARALELPLPQGARLAGGESDALDSLSLPVGPWKDGQIEVYATEGAVTRQAWTLPRSGLTTLQVMAPLRDALEKAGYEILYACKDVDCGGFDFRYQLPLLPEPEMHVDLGDFRYLAARREAEGAADFVSLTVSRGADARFVHITRVGEPISVTQAEVPVEVALPDPGAAPVPEAAHGAAEETLAARLEAEGHAVLDDLRFATGSSALEETLFPSLVELGGWLDARPGTRVILVGHSDAVGELAANIALSMARAQSVVDRLVAAHGVAPGQISAEGVGFLAPIASNATEAGRALNRRVEVVVQDTGG